MARVLVCLIILAVNTVAFGQRDLKDIPVPDPELERATFVLPDGFEVNLFAADPQIAKPIQMNFDPQGRLWIASSEVYPQIEPGQQANDKILVLEDRDRDGVSDVTRVFADGLLIPTGIEPGDDGAYVGASTELLHLVDTDHDGRADERRVVLSGFGTEDTHHILHTLRWGPEGLLYLSQSIYIHSHIETPWGIKRLNAGGIWQYRPETMQLDVYARGLVNTWGTDFNHWGATFATDGAGGEGINYMVPGASYTTAFAAARILRGLNPGSPKHCSLEILESEHFPADWQGSFIANDFRGHRVCRFVVKESGSGFVSQEQQEVIRSNHVAFRPVDIKVGPDGALYIADWYNPIIQHGEVDFRDERRDHTHGRIWRVTCKDGKVLSPPVFTQASPAELVAQLASPNAWTRRQAKRVIKERAFNGEKGVLIQALKEWGRTLDNTAEGYHHRRLEALWTYQALDVVEPELLETLLRCSNANARAAATRVVGHWKSRLTDPLRLLEPRVHDEHPRVRLEAVRVLSTFQEPRAAELVLDALDGLPQEVDEWLDYAVWLTIRDLQPVWQPALLANQIDFGGNVSHLAFALKSAGSTAAVPRLTQLLAEDKVSPEDMDDVLDVVSQFAGPQELASVLTIAVAAPEERALPMLSALLAAGRSRNVRPAGNLDSFTELLSAEQPEIQAVAARCLGAWKVDSALPVLASVAQARVRQENVRLAAIEALAEFGERPASLVALQGLVAGASPPAITREALLGLLKIRPQLGASLAADWLSRLTVAAESQPLFAAIVTHKELPVPVANALQGKALPADVAILGLRVAQSSGRPHPDLLEALRRAGNVSTEPVKLTAEEMARYTAAVAENGDAARGEVIFRRQDLACLKCHSIGPAGGLVGPNMLSLGATAQLDYIVESLLDPAAKVKEGYHTAVVATNSGQVFSGIRRLETGRDLVLLDAEDRQVSIPLDTIEDQKVGNSLMPAGLTASLTTQEIQDLAAFLSALGKQPDYTISTTPRIRLWEVMLPTEKAAFQLRRTSYSMAATDDAAFQWTRAYATVKGELPQSDIPAIGVRNRVAEGSRGVGFARFDFESTGSGSAKLQLGDGTGLQIWLDGQPLDPAADVELKVTPGMHRVTIAIDRSERSTPLQAAFSEPSLEALIKIPVGK